LLCFAAAFRNTPLSEVRRSLPGKSNATSPSELTGTEEDYQFEAFLEMKVSNISLVHVNNDIVLGGGFIEKGLHSVSAGKELLQIAAWSREARGDAFATDFRSKNTGGAKVRH
jgi:hypothetical protein